MCFLTAGYRTASAKDCTGMARAICSRKDGTAPDSKGALREYGWFRGKRSLNEKENWPRAELSGWKEVR
jgi:hypothetical protein